MRLWPIISTGSQWSTPQIVASRSRMPWGDRILSPRGKLTWEIASSTASNRRSVRWCKQAASLGSLQISRRSSYMPPMPKNSWTVRQRKRLLSLQRSYRWHSWRLIKHKSAGEGEVDGGEEDEEELTRVLNAEKWGIGRESALWISTTKATNQRLSWEQWKTSSWTDHEMEREMFNKNFNIVRTLTHIHHVN